MSEEDLLAWYQLRLPALQQLRSPPNVYAALLQPSLQ